MGDRSPKPLNDVLSYLDGLGFEHLYVSRPSTSSPTRPRQGPSRAAARSGAGQPRPTDPGVTRPSAGAKGPPATADAVVVGSPGSEDNPEDRLSPDHASRGPLPLPIIPADPTPDQRAQIFLETQQIASECRACRLSANRKTVVFGSGSPTADLMLVGEGPGSEEDRQGLPFVGPAGALLTRILQAIDLRRDEVYIANVVKCRPPSNRDPKPDEVVACRGFLNHQIALVRPKVLLALGRVAAQALLDTSSSLGSLRGRWHEVQGIQTRVTYHPAALLRNESWKRPTWEDMKVVRDQLKST